MPSSLDFPTLPLSLAPGDLVLVRSRGAGFAFGRWLTSSPYDHVAVVVRNGQTANVRKPRGALVAADRLVRPELEPLVLRPAWLEESDRDAFVTWIEKASEAPYDVGRTLRLVPRIVLRQRLGLSLPLAQIDATPGRWICTDAVLSGLERYADGFSRIRELPLDWVTLRCGTTNDFLRIHDRFPGLLRQVA